MSKTLLLGDEAIAQAFIDAGGSAINSYPGTPSTQITEYVMKSKEAAAKGIRIIPVVSSNSERDTELFARALAVTTGGDYVFLTDDSGIGDSHLEPIIGSYEVRKLYDIIIDVINDYKQ